MPLNKQALNIQLMFVSINKMICFSQKESIMTPPHPPFSRSVAVTEMMEASARVPMDQWSPHQSLQSASIVPVGGQLSVGGEGGDTYRDVDSCKSKNNRRKQRNEEKVARLREKKVTQCIICISLCFYIYFFFYLNTFSTHE